MLSAHTPLRQNIKKLGIAVSILPIVTTVQGAYLLTKFRSNHKDAPYPKSPSRGIVIVSPEDSNANHTNVCTSDNSKQNNTFDKHQRRLTLQTLWKIFTFFPTKYDKDSKNFNSNRHHSNKDILLQGQSSLRIFVVGDSLAAGVGSTSGTPVLPEAIARSLSKALGGRPVHWTCHGTPGASTSRIMRDIQEITHGDYQLLLSEKNKDIDFQMIKNGVKDIIKDLFNVTLKRRIDRRAETNTTCSVEDDKKISFEQIIQRLKRLLKQSTKEEQEVKEWNQWNSDLLRATSPKRKDAAQYDIVIVLTGLNDLKSIFLPFLQDENGTNTATFKEELRKVFYFLIGKKNNNSNENELSSSSKEQSSLNNYDNHDDDNDKNKQALVVVPALPTRVVPMLQYPPLCYVIHFFCDLIDQQKRALSKEYPGDLLFIEAPTIEMIDEIEKGEYFLCAKQKAETVLFKIQDVTKRVSNELEHLMHKHVQNHDFTDNVKEIELNYEASKNHSLTDSTPDLIGSKLVSIDNVHPNNMGYEFWGRHIAEGIINELKLRNETETQL